MLDAVPTSEDLAHQEELRRVYGERYDFRIDDVYLRAQARLGAPTREDAVAMVELFWLADGERRGDCHVSYLNLYDDQGDFAFQAYWVSSIGRVEFSDRQYY
jgi:hypothetical protein